MAKRFTSTAKWDKKWFRQLSPKLKCFWMYLCDRCDQAGVWEADFETASYMIGQEVIEADLLLFGGRLEKISDEKYWIKDFIPFQCGTLSHSSPAHKPILKLIEKYGLDLSFKVPDKQDMATVAEQLFSDEIWIEQLSMTFKGKDIRQAFQECYLWHIEKPNPPTVAWEWRQKLTSWLTIKPHEQPTRKTKADKLASDFIKRNGNPSKE